MFLFYYFFNFSVHNKRLPDGNAKTSKRVKISKFYLPTNALKSCFKRILKFTLKQLLYVSFQSPSSGSVLFELAKVIVIKIIS